MHSGSAVGRVERRSNETPPLISIRAGNGLGDALYLQSVVRHLVEKGENVEVCTAWPDVFLPLKGRIQVSEFRRERINRLAHYTNRKMIAGTDQFKDSCLAAGIMEPVDLRLDWSVQNLDLVQRVSCTHRPVIAVQLPRAPMNRSDGFGSSLLPNCNVIQRAIDRIGKRAVFVQIGSGEPLFSFRGIDLDLANQTSVTDLIDVGCAADGFLGYVSYIVPLAESLNKPALLIWSRKGLESQEPRRDFIRAITPRKILHRETSRAIIDDCSEVEFAGAVNAFCEQIRRPGTI